MELFFDRTDDYGCISVFVGKFESLEALIDYAFSKYLEEDYTKEEFEAKIEEIFLPENKERNVEEDFRAHFGAGMINQFSYDFAVVFDEDGAGADVRDFYTESLEKLIQGSRISGKETEALLEDFAQRNITLPKACNSFLLIPTIYEGYYSYIKKYNMELWYLGTYRPSEK